MLTIVMIISIIIIFAVIGITVWVTNKAYEVLPSLNEVDPLPVENEKDESDNKE